MEYLTTFGALVWQLMSVEEPHLHISFGSIFLGIFVISVGLKFLNMLFGIVSNSKGVKSERINN